MAMPSVLLLLAQLSTNQGQNWIKVPEAQQPGWRFGHTAVLDARDRMWIFAGQCVFCNYCNLCGRGDAVTASLDTETLKWMPRYNDFRYGRRHHSAAMDSHDRMWVFSGIAWNHHQCLRFQTKSQIWSSMNTEQFSPSLRSEHTAAMDSKDRMWIFGGSLGQYRYPNDLYFLDTQSNVWTTVVAANAPSGRCGHTATIDSQDRMWVFGGWTRKDPDDTRVWPNVGDDAFTDSNDLYYFDIETETWTHVNASHAPSARSGHTAAMDSQHRLWVFGGTNLCLNDLHYFDTRALMWTEVATGSIPGVSQHTAVIDSKDRMWVFGGYCWKEEHLSNISHYIDLQAIFQTCQLFPCPHDYVKKNSSRTLAGSMEACCGQTCQTFACPSGYTKTNSSRKVAGSTEACCEWTCQVFTCPRAYIKKNSSAMIAGSTEACCEQTCQVITCPDTYAKINSSDRITGSTHRCCELRQPLQLTFLAGTTTVVAHDQTTDEDIKKTWQTPAPSNEGTATGVPPLAFTVIGVLVAAVLTCVLVAALALWRHRSQRPKSELPLDVVAEPCFSGA